MHKLAWDDLKFILAVAEAGSVNAAAKRLGVNHATVLRRIAGFEAQHGVTLFERGPDGARVPPDARRLIAAAREVEAAVLGVHRVLSGRGEELSGEVRVTSTDTFCLFVLPDILAEFRRTAPRVFIDLVATNARLDLSRLDAEITVRPAETAPAGLAAEAAARLGFAIYGPAGQARGAGPEGWVGLGGTLAGSAPGRWMTAEVPPDRVVARADSFTALREMVAAGLGIAPLPCILADGDARLQRRASAMPDIAVPIWVASHPDMAETPRIRAVGAALAEGLARIAGRLAGGDQ